MHQSKGPSGRPASKDMPLRANRWWYYCPGCRTSTEHTFKEAFEWTDEDFDHFVITFWVCKCGEVDYRVETGAY